MKRVVLVLGLFLLVFSAIFFVSRGVADGDGVSVEHQELDVQSKKKKRKPVFFCPMKCEGDKVYHKKGTCPKCKMDLVKMCKKCGKAKKDCTCKKFFCPMKCEGDKVYHKKGTCPKCKMDLVKMCEKCGKAKKDCVCKKHEHKHKATFFCPMKCEGDKVYHKKGTCPKCKMDLVASK